jgi:hypothetical protein
VKSLACGAFAGLVHLGVTGLVGVLGGTGRANDGGMHKGVGVDPETSGLQFLTYLCKQCLFARQVLQIKPVLNEADAFQANGRAVIAGFRVMRFDDFAQC